MAKMSSVAELVDPLLPEIAKLLAANSITVHQYTADRERFRFLNPMIHGVEVENLELYSDYYYQLDPFVKAAELGATNGQSYVIRSSDVVEADEFLNSEFYLDFLKPQRIRYLLVFCIETQTQPMTFLGLHRSEDNPDFTKEELRIAEIITPHLSANIERICLMDDLATQQWTVRSLSTELRKPAVLILDQDFSVMFTNDQASDLLGLAKNDEDASRPIPREIIDACESIDATKLRDEGRTIEFKFSTRHGKIEGYLRVYHDERENTRYIVGLGHQADEVIQPQIYDRFNLTAREIDIVRLVCAGLTNVQIAGDLFISNRTVQNHLRSVYQKANVHSRTSLINRLLSVS